ncbi:hypothetical protein [Sphingomonas echinoides]|uniref:Uncharacterized protein n=1 Tax=Sphingomonas echinoides TaxID=59803 RepID=A0ABU4PHL4_9SPHN|nr:hypothetical protein [Sphingomonas echinoides]MDX5983683.1 hypothetical protein [Sphingomonas echinoides]
MSATLLLASTPGHAEDIGRKACFADAKLLCPAAVHAFNRKAAEACLFEKIAQTTPHCRDTILLIHEQRLRKNSKPNNR